MLSVTLILPNIYNTYRIPCGQNDTAHLRTNKKLFAQHRHADVLPGAIDFVFPQSNHPLAAQCVRRILPHRFDAALEQMQLPVRFHRRRSHQMTVQGPELLDAGATADKVQGFAVFL